MSLLSRQPRPLSRDTNTFRDDRLFIIACDDTFAPKQYFDFFRISRIQIHVVPTTDGSSAARHVLDRLLNIDHEDYDELWLLLDVDHYATGRHIPSLMATIADAKRAGVNVALNKPCFELWLLLHHVEESLVRNLGTAADVERELRAILGGYSKNNLNKNQYPLTHACTACQRAARLDQSVSGGDIPMENTARVYRIWQSIAAKALPTQLPEELRALLTGARENSRL